MDTTINDDGVTFTIEDINGNFNTYVPESFSATAETITLRLTENSVITYFKRNLISIKVSK